MHPPKLIRNYANTEKRYDRWLREPGSYENGQLERIHAPTIQVCPNTILDQIPSIKPTILSNVVALTPHFTAVGNEKKSDLHCTAPSTFEPDKLSPRPGASSQREIPLSEFSYETRQVAERWFNLRYRIPIELPTSFIYEFGLAYRHMNGSDEPNSIVVHPLLTIASVPFESIMSIEEDCAFLHGLVTKQDGKYGCYKTKVSAKDWAASQRGLHLLAEHRSQRIVANLNLNKRSLAEDVLHILEGDSDCQDDELLQPCKHETPVSPFLFIPTNSLEKRRKTLKKNPTSRIRLKLGLKISSSKIIRDRPVSPHRPPTSLRVVGPEMEGTTSQDLITIRSSLQKLVIRIPQRAVDRRDMASAYQK